MNGIVNQKVDKPEILDVGVIYKLVDIYCVNIEKRIAIVGGLQLQEDAVKYIWLPESLVRNVKDEEQFANMIMANIKKSKFLYCVYKGSGLNKSGRKFYDMAWVRNSSRV